jgi:uncharacterized protein (UPF0276 family)
VLSAPADRNSPDPAPVGIGWRHGHHALVLEQAVEVDFLEVHSENFFGSGGAARAVLLQGRERHPISLHGVGLALGSAAGLDPWHLDQLAQLVACVEPIRVSDHACCARASRPSQAGDPSAVHASDLLPIAFDDASLAVLCANVQRVQDRLGRAIAVENLSAYVAWAGGTWAEADFLNALCQKTGCSLLVDVNNLYVNALNAAGVPHPGSSQDLAALAACRRWLDSVAPTSVAQLHVAGHSRVDDEHGCIVIDDHGSCVPQPVWDLAAHALQRFGAVPVLIEWDTDLPDLSVLLGEARTARALSLPEQAAPIVDSVGPSGAQQAAPEVVQQQAALVEALLAPVPVLSTSLQLLPVGPKATVWRGLQAYRSNGHAIAERALRAAYPVTAQSLGEEAFAELASALWHTHPPTRGDLAQWGSELAEFMRRDPQLAPWPYLPDVVTLEWLLHVAATAADADPDANSLQTLLTAPPDTVGLVLAPAAALVPSQWPVVSIWEAHSGFGATPPGPMPDWADLRLAVQERRAQTALVWREGLRPRCRATGSGEAALLNAAHRGASLLEAAEQAALDPEFSFDAWLPAAWHSGLLLGLRTLHDQRNP